jgi:DNA-binding transcriptional ArsR family regulator
MQGQSKQTDAEGPLLRGALRHPKRVGMLSYLMDKGKGIEEAELAAVLGLTLPGARYHLTILRGAGLVTVVDRPASSAAGRQVVAAVGR